MKRILLIALLSVSIFTSCHHMMKDKVDGNGIIKTENRKAGTFIGVDVGGSIDLYVKQDSARSVRVEADENLMQYIEVKMEGDKLVIQPKDGYNLSGSKHIKVYVSSPVLNKLEASGACDIIGEGLLSSTDEIIMDVSGASDVELELKAPKVSAEITGASNLKLKGQTKELYISGSGASHAKCFELLSENVKVDVSGASSADVFASVKLNADATGASDVRYKGNAAVSQSASGAGSVKKVD